jgi:hypothetical protein
MIVLLAAMCMLGPIPDSTPACTPGAYVALKPAQVCTHKDRPSLPAADRRRILVEYGVPNWTGAMGEIDHRVPFALGGLTNAQNLWPEAGPIPNQKDRLEDYVYRRVCHYDPVTGKLKPTMRVKTAVRIFLRPDWRREARRYHLDLSTGTRGRS